MRRAAFTALGTVALLVAALPATAARPASPVHRDQVHPTSSPLRAANAPSAALSATGLWATPARAGDVRPVRWGAFVTMVKERQAKLAQVGRKALTFEIVFTSYLISPDLNGDGRPDLVEVVATSGSNGDSTVITAHRGLDGGVLWRKSSTTFDFPVPARVGPKAVNGLYVFSYGTTDAAVGFVGTLGVSAIDNVGKAVWSKSFNGGEAGALVADGSVALPYPVSVASISADSADDVLLVSQTETYSLLDEHHLSQLEVLSGADGSSVSKVGPLATVSGFDLPAAVSDLSGDKRADLVAVTIDPATQLGTLNAYRGTDGSKLWSTKAEYYESFPSSVSDMTGDGRSDLLAYTADYRLRLINGATGATAWTRAEGQVLDLGDIGRDRREDIAVISYTGSADGMRMTISAVTGANSTRWSHTVKSSHSGAQVYAWYAGDLQGDGVQDLMVVSDYKNQNAEGRHHYFLDGRTGRILRDNLAKGEYGAFGAIDGHGDDVLVGTVTKADRALVVARRGEDERKLWTWNGPAGTDPPEGWAYDLSGDRHADVLLFSRNFDKGSLSLTVLDGRTGKTRWHA